MLFAQSFHFELFWKLLKEFRDFRLPEAPFGMMRVDVHSCRIFPGLMLAYNALIMSRVQLLRADGDIPVFRIPPRCLKIDQGNYFTIPHQYIGAVQIAMSEADSAMLRLL